MTRWYATHDETSLPCGCTDYHLADCPLRTGSYSPDPGDQSDDWYANW